jgi:hypothetical protein
VIRRLDRVSYIEYIPGTSMTRASIFAGFLLVAGCGSPVEQTSVQVDQVTFNPGCGVVPESDCSFGFVMSYVQASPDAQTIVTHVTDNDARTVDITVSSSSQSQGHEPQAAHADADLGLLDVKVGQTYAVTVFDSKHAVLWSGNVDTIYHL